MERSPVVNWEEVFSTNDRGRKEVRYYLKRRDGTSDLAVIGKEKRLGHRMKTTSSSSSSSLYRYRFAIRDKSLFPSKLRSRREVIDWLSTLVTEFLWVGSASTCRKKRKHYEAYTRSGVRISAHDFVYVLAEEGKRLVAYLDDLYEDIRGNKMAVVRWFHKVDEVGLDLPRNNYNDKEIFFSLCLQDLSIKCIDGLATVLSPQHFDKFLKVDAHTILDPFVCRYQIDNEVVKPFDVTQVKGYWNQSIHRFMSSADEVGVRPRKRLRKLVDGEFNHNNTNLAKGFVSEYKHEYTVGSEIEVLSQDSGIRGMWFKAVIIKKHKDKIKVRYQDIKDATDESINLEEWILSLRVADDDQLGIRFSRRMMIRPSRLCKKIDICLVDVGCVVDAWLHDGWWEGIVVRKESDDRIHVYFPDEKRRSILGCKDLRYSEEWVGDQWKQMKNRQDLVGSISSTTETNSHDNTSGLTGMMNEKEPKDRGFEVVDHRSKEDLLTRLTWNWSTKKRRCYAYNEGCKFIRDPSPFCAPVASPLTSLVISR